MPNKGSEEKIGWNVPLESAKTNNVYVITKEEHRKTIEEYLLANNIKNIKFYFVDIPKIYKKVFRGSMYSLRLNKWHKRAFPVAEKICKENNIDIIHQITPIEFRSIGDYGKIKGIKFVCGPIGGGEYIPKGLFSYAQKFVIVEWLRTLLNTFYRMKFWLTKKLSRCDYILFANKETMQYLRKLTVGIRSEIYFDNGISAEDFVESKKNDIGDRTLNIIVAGRLAYRKGHALLFDALKEMPTDAKYCVLLVSSCFKNAFLYLRFANDGTFS